MKRWIKWAAAAVLLLALVWLMAGRDYHESAMVERDGVRYYLRADRLRAFAGVCVWDGEGDTVDYHIPDRVDGAKVTSLGGLIYGTAFKKLSCGWGVALPETFRGAERVGFLPQTNVTELTLTVRLHLGRYVSGMENIGELVPVGYYSTGASYIIRQKWVVTCDERNETYYAEDGRLYYRGSGEPVELCYETE